MRMGCGALVLRVVVFTLAVVQGKQLRAPERVGKPE
jgi:hypothetical protein